MRKVYVKPSVESFKLFTENLMLVESIANEKGNENETQGGVESNDKDGFWAGSKGNHNAWNAWDE